jgi:hypothetical protein
MNDRLRRLIEIEMHAARSAPGLSPIEELALRDPRSLTDQQCVEVWRYYARKRLPDWAPPPVSPAGEREILRLWRELTA